MSSITQQYLIGDIGGTKTVLALFTGERGPHNPLEKKTFPSVEFGSLEEIIAVFLARKNVDLVGAGFGVAGPVSGGSAEITNLSWIITEANLEKALQNIPVTLLNDLEAMAHSIPFIEPNGLVTLNQGIHEPEGALALIAPGTGLGEAFLTWNGTGYDVNASEGGHSDFAPSTPLQLEMLRILGEKFGHVSFERVCSGRGLPNIYNFLKESGHAEEPDWLSDRLATVSDPTPVIIEGALDRDEPCELCRATVEIFINILGREAGNLALKVLATGGVYLGGGIPPRILPVLQEEKFLEAFKAKGRMAEVLAQIPVHVIVERYTVLKGTAIKVLPGAVAGHGPVPDQCLIISLPGD